MANTTNFGWETPDDTDLVKDGALAMRTLGNAIDTSLVDLKGGTTGQVLSKNTNTDMDFTWVTPNDADAIQNSIMDAKGDLISASAADTPARLASSGVNGDVLTVDTSTSTGLKWAAPSSGGMTLINTGGTDLTGSSAVTVSSIPGTYKHLYLVVEDAYQASAAGGVYLRFNGDSGANYYWNMIRNINTTLVGRAGAAATSIDIGTRNGSTNTNYKKGQIEVTIPRYTNTSPKSTHSQSYDHDDTNTASSVVSGVYVGGSAISSLTVLGDFNFSGGTIYVYGVN